MSKRFSRRGRVGRTALLCIVAALSTIFLKSTAQSQEPSEVRLTLEYYYPAEIGSQIELALLLQNNLQTQEFGGFDLLVQYDTGAVTFVDATEGQLLIDCEWEYFDSRLDDAGLVRIVMIADINDGVHTPVCYLDSANGELALLTFDVKPYDSLECTASPLRFYWNDCGDNAAANRLGDTLFLSDRVWDMYYFDYIEQDGPLPTIYGAPDSCLTGGSGTTPPQRLIDFFNGVIDVECPTWPDERGDLNLNGVGYEIADYLLFVSYFIEGLSVFTLNVEAQISASDANADGLVLTLDDLVYIYRVIIGDADPIPAKARFVADTALIVQDTAAQAVFVNYPDSLAVAYLTFAGEITPQLEADDMDIAWAYSGGATRVLIYPGGSFEERVSFSDGLLLTYAGDGVLANAEVADYEGNEIYAQISFAAPEQVVVLVSDFSFDPRQSSVQVPVYMRNPADSVAGFAVDLRVSDDTELYFDTTNPVAEWGEIVDDWIDLIAVDYGEPGAYLRLLGLVSGAEPIAPDSSFRLLATVNLIPIDSVGMEHCDSSGAITVEHTDFSDPFGMALESIGLGAEYTIVCLKICGDVNYDGIVNVSDAVYLICWVFGTCEPPPYPELADVNLDGMTNVSDAVYLLAYIFSGGPPPCP